MDAGPSLTAEVVGLRWITRLIWPMYCYDAVVEGRTVSLICRHNFPLDTSAMYAGAVWPVRWSAEGERPSRSTAASGFDFETISYPGEAVRIDLAGAIGDDVAVRIVHGGDYLYAARGSSGWSVVSTHTYLPGLDPLSTLADRFPPHYGDGLLLLPKIIADAARGGIEMLGSEPEDVPRMALPRVDTRPGKGPLPLRPCTGREHRPERLRLRAGETVNIIRRDLLGLAAAMRLAAGG